MSWSQKTAVVGKNKRKRVKFSRFCRRKEGQGLVALESVGCDCRGGRLRRGLGYRAYRFDDERVSVGWKDKSVSGVYPLSGKRGNALVLAATDGYLYVRIAGVWERMVFVGECVYLRMRVDSDTVYHLFVGTEGVYYTLDGAVFIRFEEGAPLGGAIAGKRLFLARRGGVVVYSAPFAPTKTSGAEEGGELYMPAAFGEIVAIVGTQKYLYLFGERDVCRVEVKADAGAFTVEPLAYAGGRILPNAAARGGLDVFFLAENGLYRIDGERIEGAFDYLSLLPSYQPCRVGRAGSNLLLDYVERSGEKRRLALSADGKEGGFLFPRGTLCGGALFVDGGTAYGYPPFSSLKDMEEEEEQPYFSSGWEGLGTAGKKRLKKLTVRGEGSLEIEVRSEGSARRYAVVCKGGRGEALLADTGRAFLFTLFPLRDCDLESMTVEFVYLEE